MKKNRYTITAALPYTNGSVHIGHLAGVYIPADIFARFLRLKNKEVAFICGSDEHGVPITISAKKEGVTPQQIVDKYHKIIKDSFTDFGISFDNYSRTSAEIHHETASEFFLKLYENGKFIEEISEQYFDEAENQFLADRYIIGTCPNCANENAYGDQCEKCGSTLSPKELVNPKSTLSGNKPILKETKHWYLPLDKYENFLKKWILEGHKEWKPNVYGQVKSWIDNGLQPRAVTRDLDWGIKVPTPPNLPKGEEWDGEGKVLYVWFDAPIGYISATKEWAKNTGKNWEDYWKSEDTELIHFIGKDNIVFHCIIFPVMLKAYGEYILPENVPANEFLNLENDKISTSRNWAVWLDEYLVEFPNQQDVLRYVLTSNMPETKDNNFTWADFQIKNNSELVAILGNFVNRTSVLTQKYYEGIVPKPNDFSAFDKVLLQEIKEIPHRIENFLKDYKFRDALSEMMLLARLGNKYLADEEPWKVIKENPERVKTILFCSLQVVGALAYFCEPFLPFTAKKLRESLHLDAKNWNEINDEFIVNSDTKIEEIPLLFSKIEDEQIQFQMEKLNKNKEEREKNKEVPSINMEDNISKISNQKSTISFDDFQKIDLRTGTILEAEKVEKSKKLLKLKVDTGIDVRTIVSGIAESFTAEEVVGKQVMVLVNLAPRDIMKIESNGMLLLTEKPNGKLSFVTPDEKVNNGEIIG